ncbi:predicted protein [Aspergillus terreus NIH2624]|uniref:Helicase C-terminal domain-containing protein n=1 Tax=Aspergillus terreus (strain NIH 2624 / FGSC A1156) TaxID=341663 RepID=Q0CX83_ASPTN|nr:uncharacterized protein ATEG_01701 [Aspergillus terreus NIH2624]EAU38458.1 predicted protein [Aspergillus terreus NIH2624]
MARRAAHTPALASWKLRWVVLMFLHMTGVGFRTTVAVMTADERAQAANAFNSEDSGVVVLVTSFASGGVGLNVHDCCSSAIFVEPPPGSTPPAESLDPASDREFRCVRAKQQPAQSITADRAVRLLEYNADKTPITIEWHWQPTSPADRHIAVNTTSPSLRNLVRHLSPTRVASLFFREIAGDPAAFIRACEV